MLIPLNLILDMVLSSSADVTRALRGYFRGGFVYVSFRFRARENLQRCGDAFDIMIKSQGASALDMFFTFRLYGRKYPKQNMERSEIE